MPSHPTPIRAKPAVRDPLRNFKFRVDFVGNKEITKPFASMGFISVGGLGVQTDMIPYREGGDNTTTRKMPGQSDFGPLTMMGGVFMHPINPQFEWFRRIFDVQWGEGNGRYNDEFRADCIIRVLKHPVTKFSAGGEGDPASNKSAGAAFRVYNCWPSAVQYNDLNAGDNSIMVTTMQLQHEGFTPWFGEQAAQVR